VGTIDYRLTDPHLDPPGLLDGYYSEQSVRLPDSFWCYDPLADGPVVGPLPALNTGCVTFGCLNNFCKVNSGVLEVWARVLSAVERSRLLLLAPEGSARDDVQHRLGECGVSADRVTFVSRQPRAKYLELYQQIDIGLDTWPYNGHTTSLDAFWMGVPVVTLVGQTVVGRAGLCQLENLGLSQLVARCPDEFVTICVRLASERSALANLRQLLRGRLTESPLMNSARFTRHLEQAYRTMWERWSAERP
jgi:predicted O-linked N-acetylglucosamine transferase (SPINDLY family)